MGRWDHKRKDLGWLKEQKDGFEELLSLYSSEAKKRGDEPHPVITDYLTRFIQEVDLDIERYHGTSLGQLELMDNRHRIGIEDYHRLEAHLEWIVGTAIGSAKTKPSYVADRMMGLQQCCLSPFEHDIKTHIIIPAEYRPPS